MTTRLRSGDPQGVPSGYEDSNVPGDHGIAPCGLEDVDKAMFRTLKDEVAFQVSDDPGKQQRVPIVFAVGEKWSMLKSGRALRDKDGTLILPLVTVYRSSVAKGSDDVVRGTNQHVGAFVVKRRLAKEDRAYQNLINKTGVPNSEDCPGFSDVALDAPLTTLRSNNSSREAFFRSGNLLEPSLGTNVWEIVSIPSPQFFTVTYQITLWAQYTQHMNQMLERLMASYLPTSDRTLRLDTDKGYWFVARFDEEMSPEDNYSESSGAETIRKCKLTVTVPAYLVETSAPGFPTGARRYVSAPAIAFDVSTEVPPSDETNASITDPEALFRLSDVGRVSKERIPLVMKRRAPATEPFFGKKLRPIESPVFDGETIYTQVDDE